MRAAFLLRLREARRRGGLPLLAVALALVVLPAVTASGSAGARYALATDIAATLGYLAAVLYGAFPLALDRERRRSTLAAATPVTPLGWAIGNALGAAAIGLLVTALLFAAAGTGAALGGAPATYRVTRIADHGSRWLPVDIRVPDDAHKIRLVLRADLAAEAGTETPEAPTISLNGETHVVSSGRAFTFPIAGGKVALRNLTPEFRVNLPLADVRALGSERPFLGNALGAALAPALGAAAIGALACAASAHLSAPVAALLAALLLCLASMKGFLKETLAYEGTAHVSVDPGGSGGRGESVSRAGARRLLTALLAALPDLSRLDRSAEVSAGEWVGGSRVADAALVLAVALVLAAPLGAVGLRTRRLG